MANEHGVSCARLGEVTAEKRVIVAVNGEAVIDVELDELTRRWEEAIPCMMTSSASTN
jgi:phosphoribosylformylglycinamidine synthase